MREIVIRGWKELVDLEAELDFSGKEWIFRGLSSEKYRLLSTLDRARIEFEFNDDQISPIEDQIIHEFKNSCHLYSNSVFPHETDIISWLALMRHYGAPCRLMDFTYSLFIATFFAVEPENSRPVVWAVSKTWLGEHMKNKMGKLPYGKRYLKQWVNRESAVIEKLFLKRYSSLNIIEKIFIKRYSSLNIIAPMNPRMMNNRLLVQQGLFLCCSDVTVPFHNSLEKIPDSQNNNNMFLIRICGNDARKEILARLYRTGVNRAALFPGLQGYAESFRQKIPLFQQLRQLRKEGQRYGPTTIATPL